MAELPGEEPVGRDAPHLYRGGQHRRGSGFSAAAADPLSEQPPAGRARQASRLPPPQGLRRRPGGTGGGIGGAPVGGGSCRGRAGRPVAAMSVTAPTYFALCICSDVDLDGTIWTIFPVLE